MEGSSDGSASPRSSLTKKKRSRVGTSLKTTGSQARQDAWGSALQIPEPQSEEAEDPRTDLMRVEDSIMNPDRVSPPVTGTPPPVERHPLSGSFCPEGLNAVSGDRVLPDPPGGEASPCRDDPDLNPVQGPDGPHPPNDRTDAEGRASPGAGESGKKNIYHSVLHQMLQQQKHKRGRKHKKKTLMKMAQLLVIAKGWDHRENQSLTPEEQSNLKEEILTTLRRERAPEAGPTGPEPEDPKISNSQPADLSLNPAPGELKKSREIHSDSVREAETCPDGPQPVSKFKKRAAKDPKALGKKKDSSDKISRVLSGSDFTELTIGQDPELRSRRKTAEPSKTSVSSGRKWRRKRDSLTPVQVGPTAAEATAESKTGWFPLGEELMSSQSGSSGSAGRIQETQPQETTDKPRTSAAEQLPTAANSLQEQNQTNLGYKDLLPDMFSKSTNRKPGKRGGKAKTPLSTASVWDLFPSAETSGIQNETRTQQTKEKFTKTLRVKEEKNDALNQQQDRDPIKSQKKPKGRRQKERVTEETLNFHIKTEPVWESAVNQPDVQSANPAIKHQSDRKRKPRKRKQVEVSDTSQRAEAVVTGSAGDEAGKDVELQESWSKEPENPGLHTSDEAGEGFKCRKPRRSCTLGNKTTSAAEEWLIRYLKGSRRRPVSKGSNRKAEGNLDDADLVGEYEQLMSENVRLSVNSPATPCSVRRKRKKPKQEPPSPSELDEGGSGFLNLPSSDLVLNRSEEVTLRRKKGEGQKRSVSSLGDQPGATPESSESKAVRSLDFNPKMAQIRMTKGPKRRRILKTQAVPEPKIQESDKEHPHEGDKGSLQHGRKSGRQSGATPEPLESDNRNVLQIEGTSDLTYDFLGVDSKVMSARRKPGRKKRRVLKKDIKLEPRVLESDAEDGKTSNLRRGRKKKVFPTKTVDGGSCLMDNEVNKDPERVKSPLMPSFLDKNNMRDSGGQTGAMPESSESASMCLPQIEETSDLTDDVLGVDFEATTSIRKAGPKKRRVLKKEIKLEPRVLESNGKPLQVWDARAPEDGKTSNVRRGRKKKVFPTKTVDGGSCLTDTEVNKDPERETSLLMPSFQDKNPATDSGDQTEGTRGMVNLCQTGETCDLKDSSVELYSNVCVTKKQRGRNFKSHTVGLKILESHEDQPYDSETGAPQRGKISKTANIRRRRKGNISTVKTEDGASCFMGMEAIRKEPKKEKSYQESGSSAASRKPIGKRRRRSKTHWTGHKKAKKPQICSFSDGPAASSFPNETLNLQDEVQENQRRPNVPSGPKTVHRLQVQKEKKSLQCFFCSRSFRHISAFTLHKRLHTGRKPYGCSVCTKTFSRLSQLKLHSKLHSERPATCCPCCEETFRNKTELICHFKIHLNEVERLQTEMGRNRLSRSSASQDKTFRCSVCSKEFTKESSFERHRKIHDKQPLSCRKTFRDPSKVRGFLVSQLGDAAVVTPVFFRCPICKQMHLHWCHYVLHLQSHSFGRSHCCDECKQEYSQATGTRRHCSACCRASGEEKVCRASLKNIWREGSSCPDAEQISAIPEQECHREKVIPSPSPSGSSLPENEDFDLDVLSLSSGFSSVSNPTPNRASQFQPPRLSRKSLFGRYKGISTLWNKQGLHRRLRQRSGQAFHCSHCELGFHFLGSYMDHLQEHASDETQLNFPTSSCHAQSNTWKCSTCGKPFSTLRNLQRHKFLHKGTHSHICLPCSRSFACRSALKAHLEIHRRRLSVPQPARMEEPFVFPYPCRKCSARFSSTDLLQAHQICHSVAGRKPESPPESILSFIPDVLRFPAPSPGPKRPLPVSNRKDLFRYPHPDCLYVVPDVSSERPAVVPDTVEETDGSPHNQPTSAELQLQLLVQSLIPERRLNTSDSSDSESEQTTRRANHTHNCAICTKAFPDITALHDHYRNHARGV